MVSKIEVWKKRMSPKESGNEDLDLDLTKFSSAAGSAYWNRRYGT